MMCTILWKIHTTIIIIIIIIIPSLGWVGGGVLAVGGDVGADPEQIFKGFWKQTLAGDGLKPV